MIPEYRPTRLPVFLASALSKLYTIGINHQNRKYDRGIGVTTLDRPVISVGNLSTGGTGKTPVVQHVVRKLMEQGHHPAIAMRGYKAKAGQMSDEEREHSSAFVGVPIVAQPDRAAGLHELFASECGEQIDCVVLDDGFQHRKIARDLDIVLIDASRPPSRDALLPLGFLRESAESLSRADVILITHSEMVEQNELGMLRGWIESNTNHDPLVVVGEHAWSSVDQHDPDGQVTSCPVEILKDQRVAILTGIGHPEAFAEMAVSSGAHVFHRCDRPDHEEFSIAVLEQFVRDARSADAILMTMKDWCRLESSGFGANWQGGLPVYLPRLDINFRSGGEQFHRACIEAVASR